MNTTTLIPSQNEGLLPVLVGNNDTKKEFSEYTMIGALAKYISTENDKFQPMNANFGIVPELGEKIKDKKLKYGKLADRALEYLEK